MTTEHGLLHLEDEPDTLDSVGMGVAIRKEDQAMALALVVNGRPYLVNWESLAALAAAVEEGVRILDRMDGGPHA